MKENISFNRLLRCHVSVPANKRIIESEALEVNYKSRQRTTVLSTPDFEQLPAFASFQGLMGARHCARPFSEFVLMFITYLQIRYNSHFIDEKITFKEAK